MGSKEKGNRRERQARKILEAAGYDVITPNSTKFQREDFFDLFDIIAINPGEKPLFIQVKSNKARKINEFEQKVQETVPWEYVNVQFWVCYDRQGWRIIGITEGGERNEILDERNKKGKMGETVKNYLRKSK